MKADAQGLRHRSDKIDMFAAGEGENGTGAENEHQGNDRRGDEDGETDVASGRSSFAGKNGDVFKSAHRADGQLAKDVEREHRQRGHSESKRLVFLQFAARERDERQHDHRAISDEHDDAAGVVDPFA